MSRMKVFGTLVFVCRPVLGAAARGSAVQTQATPGMAAWARRRLAGTNQRLLYSSPGHHQGTAVVGVERDAEDIRSPRGDDGHLLHAVQHHPVHDPPLWRRASYSLLHVVLCMSCTCRIHVYMDHHVAAGLPHWDKVPSIFFQGTDADDGRIQRIRHAHCPGAGCAASGTQP